MVLKLAVKHKQMETTAGDLQAPMPAGPIIYREDGQIDWGNMWDSFCMLALDGGPPHRGEMLRAPARPDMNSLTYHYAVVEIVRGIQETTGLQTVPHQPGWCAVSCRSAAQARWMAEAVEQENVEARCEGCLLLVPVGDDFHLKKEIKNVITAVAKTCHYWDAHLAAEVKQTLAVQAGLRQIRERLHHLYCWLSRPAAGR